MKTAFMSYLKFSSVKYLIIITSLFLLNISTSDASNVGGVFGPTVNLGDKTFQYRAAYDSDTSELVQRVHYQQSLNDDVRLRGVIQARRTENSDVDVDFFQGELLWQLKNPQRNWQTAVRFDARIADQGRRGLVAATWTNNIKWSKTLSTTALVLGSIDVGPDSRSGLFLQTRVNLSKKLNDVWKLNGELFSVYGSTADFNSFDEQTHQFGPSVSAKIGGGWSVLSGILFGVNSSSPDENLRFWLTKGF